MTNKIAAAFSAVLLAFGIIFAGAFAAPASNEAQAVPYHSVSNRSPIAIRVDSFYGGTFWQQPYTSSYYPSDSRWSIGSSYTCTFRYAGGSDRTYRGPITLYLQNSVTITRCSWTPR